LDEAGYPAGADGKRFTLKFVARSDVEEYASMAATGRAKLYLLVVRRVLYTVPIFLTVIILNFSLIHLAPGNPVYMLLGEGVTPEIVAEYEARFGLDKDILTQFWLYITNVLKGDLGYSYFHGKAVLTIILSKLPLTLLLMVSAFLFSWVVGIFLGTAAAKKPYTLEDHLISGFSLIFYCTPGFFLGAVLITTFSLWLNLFPSVGYVDAELGLKGVDLVLNILHHLALPAATLGMWYTALMARMTRGNIINVMKMDFIKTARAKGLTEKAIMDKHALKNAMLPLITVMGLNVAFAFAGAIVTETVFGWPGMGRLFFQSVGSRDYPLLMGIFLLTSVMVLLSNLATDILYTVFDPRVRLEV
jgi:peptide/nickel transport system permease protein